MILHVIHRFHLQKHFNTCNINLSTFLEYKVCLFKWSHFKTFTVIYYHYRKMFITSGKWPCKFLKYVLYHELNNKQKFVLILLTETRTYASQSKNLTFSASGNGIGTKMMKFHFPCFHIINDVSYT